MDMRKSAAVLLALLFSAVFVTGCKEKEQTKEEYPGTLAETQIWTTSATEKVLKEKSYEEYEEIRTDGIRILAARNEYESGHIILSDTGEKGSDVRYQVQTEDLKSGSDTLSASNAAIFHEKYIRVSTTSEEAGGYPDALVPYENIVEAGENVVRAGENQGLYVRWYIPADQAPGVYTGSITVTIGGESKKIPVTVEVRGVTVPDENHTQSVFLNEWYFYRGELDSTQEMFDKYNEALFEYRLNPNYILYDFDVSSEEGIQAYVDKAYEYLSENSLCSTISLPYASAFMSGKEVDEKYGQYLRLEPSEALYLSDHENYDFTEAAYAVVKNSGTLEALDGELMEKYIAAFAEKSFSEGYDMFSKLVTYFRMIDETHDSLGYSRVKMISVIFRGVANKAADEMLANKAQIIAQYAGLDAKAKANGYASAGAFIEAAAESLRSMYHVATIAAQTDYNEILPYLEGGCPLFDAYDGEEGRARYNSQTKRWWYGCVAPEPPYATYRIDDSMVDPRLVSWMQAQYGVVGNLYWSTTIYADNLSWTYQPIYDYYEGNAMRYPGANGDGFLFYPGAQYGVDGPVASMRLEAIRDGLEEYELLYAMRESYEANGLDSDEDGDGVSDEFADMMKDLVSDLYEGTVVTADSQSFAAARETLFGLYELNASEAKFSPTGRTSDGGTQTLTFAAAADAEVALAEGMPASVRLETPGTNEQGMKLYTVTADMTANDSNSIALSILAGGKEYAYEVVLGGRVYVNEVTDESVTAADVSGVDGGVAVSAEKAGEELIVHLDARLNTDTRQGFTLGGSMINGIGENTDRAEISVRGPAGRSVTVYLVGEKGLTTLGTVFFDGETGTAVLSFDSVNWSKVGAIQSLRFEFVSGTSEATVAIGQIVVYGK